MRDEPRAVLRGSEPWPVCTAHVGVIGIMLDCVRPRWHAMDGVDRHLSSTGVEWSLDMALTELSRIELNP